MLEDMPADAELCEYELRQAGLEFSAQRVYTQKGFEEALSAFSPDLIISDFSMPGAFDGLHALDIAHERVPDTPFVFVSGTIGEERAVEAMKRGATDYVLKDRLHRLAPVIKRALKEHAERTALRETEHELDRTRSRLDRILSSLVDVVWSVSTTSCETLYVNDAAAAMYGRPVSDFTANPRIWLESVHPGDRARIEALWKRALEGEAFEAEYRIVTPEGVQRWIHNRAQPVCDDTGSITRVDGLARDVTERRSHEEKITRLSRVRAVLSGINAAIVRVSDKQQLYADACHIAVHGGGFKEAWIGDVDPQTLRSERAASCCDYGQVLHNSLTVQERGGAVGALLDQAISTGRPSTCNDVAAGTMMIGAEGGTQRDCRSVAILPLNIAERVTAVLALYADEPDFFDEEEMKLLEDLAGNLSFALNYMDQSSRLDHLAYYDSLTGLPNRTLFQDRLAQMIARAAAEQEQVIVVVADIERFRSINESMGAASADTLLRRTAERFAALADDAGTSARMTADIFAVALPAPADDGDGMHRLVERLQQLFEAPFNLDGQSLRIQAKAGIAVYPADAGSGETLFANAEAALRNAKSLGERFAFYAPAMNYRVADMLRLENQMRVALREEQFVLYYQPRILLQTGVTCGLEALIRWHNPETGIVPPCDFIPLLEETGLILEVGRWALRRAALDAHAWRALGLAVPPIGVNVSALQLRQKNFIEETQAALAAVPGMHDAIEIELTESMIMSDVEGNVRKLQQIREAGIKIAIDDFGTGYSSLSYLAQLPLDTLKVDRSFVSAMTNSPVHMAIVTTIISLARSLNLRVVAEGVETEEQANLLRLLNCDEAQGYLYSKPLPPQEIAKVLRPARVVAA
jgi:diguanylate cyclase (GGDEF)-like protein/PAS domain S-box-containing protein